MASSFRRMVASLDGIRAGAWLRAATTLITAAISIFSLWAWWRGDWKLAALAANTVPMAPTTALVFLLFAIALALHQCCRTRSIVRMLVLAVAAVGGAVALVILVQDLANLDSDWERWLAESTATVRDIPVGRMAPFTADLFLLAAVSLVMLRPELARRAAARGTGRIAALLGAGWSMLTVLAYATGRPLFYGGGLVPMALPTAVAFMALNLSLLLATGADETGQPFLFDRNAISTRERVLFVGLISVVLVLVTMASSLYLRFQQASLRRHLVNELTAIATQKVQHIADWRAERLHDVRLLMRTPYLVRSVTALSANPRDDALRADLLAWMALVKQTEKIDDIVIYNRAMQPLLALPSSARTSGARTDSLLAAAPNARDVLEADFHASSSGGVRFSLLGAIREENQPMAGAILLRINPESSLGPILQNWPVPNGTGEALLMRHDGGRMISIEAEPRSSGPGLSLSRIRVARAAPHLLGATIPHDATELIHDVRDFRGEAVLAIAQPVPGTPWFVVTKVNRAKAYAPLRQQAAVALVAMIAILCAAALGAALLWRLRGIEFLQREVIAEKTREALARRLTLVMQHANDVIFMLDAQGRIVEANHRAVATYGYTLDELRALPPDGLRPTEMACDQPQQLELFATPGGAVFETLHRRKDGSVFPVEVSGSAFEIEGQLFKLGVYRDISQRKAHEAQIERLTRLYAALSAINQTIVRGGTAEELFSTICRVIVEISRFKLVWIGWRDQATQRVNPVASFGDEPGYAGLLKRVADEAGTPGPVAMAIHEKRTVVFNDIAADPRTAPWHDVAAQAGFRAAIALPVRLTGQVAGALAVYASEPDCFGDREIALLEEAATDLSFALDNLERERQRSEAEKRVADALHFKQTLIATLPIGIMAWDDTGRCFVVNETLARIVGGTREQILAQNFRTLDSWRKGGLLAAAESVFSTGADQELETEFLSTFGKRAWLSCRFMPFQHEGKRHVLVSVIDATTRHQADQRIREQAELIDKANEAIVVGDLEHRITFWNHGAERLFGWSASEMIGRPVSDVLTLNGVADDATVRTALTAADDWRGEICGRKRSGEPIVIETSITVLRDESGRPTARLSISTDVTEKKQLAAQFLRAQRLENLGMLAAGISHDLNNVLAPIQMAAPLLRRETSTPAELRMLDTLESCAERGAALVKQILGFAHGIGGEPRLVQVKHILRDVATMIRETFPKAVVFEDSVPSELWPVMANPTQLHQVLLNLCVNARDAMPDGGRLRLVGENCTLDDDAAAKIAGGRPGPWLVLHVEDTGSGIAPELRDRVWEPFFTTKAADKGTGLGLSTVRGIVENHRGFITLQTELGRGTTFRVYLPAAGKAEGDGARAKAPRKGRGRGELVLVVDDEEFIRETVAAILKTSGYRTITAVDGADAVMLFAPRGNEFSLVITDLDMPNLNGPALARVIRAAQPAMKILAMSGLTSRETNETPSNFADGFLGKPFSPEALLNEMQRLLSAAPMPGGSGGPKLIN